MWKTWFLVSIESILITRDILVSSVLISSFVCTLISDVTNGLILLIIYSAIEGQKLESTAMAAWASLPRYIFALCKCQYSSSSSPSPSLPFPLSCSSSSILLLVLLLLMSSYTLSVCFWKPKKSRMNKKPFCLECCLCLHQSLNQLLILWSSRVFLEYISFLRHLS